MEEHIELIEELLKDIILATVSKKDYTKMRDMHYHTSHKLNERIYRKLA